MRTSEVLLQAAAAAALEPFSAVVQRIGGASPRLAAVRPDEPFYPASMIKTPLAAAALALAERGELGLRDTLAVTPSNMTANDESSPLVPGYRSTLLEVIELAIARSDNVATNMLYDIVERRRATAIVQKEFGLRATAFHRKLSGSEPLIDDPQWDGVHRNAHPASDAARLFALIATGRIPLAHILKAALESQRWNDKLPGGLLPGDRFAHKTGDTSEVTHDGGIVHTNDGASYVVVVYTGMESNPENNARFAPFMRAIRPFLL